jgi:CSLREA domain-containing protein
MTPPTSRLLTAAVLVAIAASLFGAARPVFAVGLTFVVNKTGDSADRNIGNGKCDTSTKAGNQCTLRAAIQEANATTIGDTINFKITTTPRVIAPNSPLPAITQPVTIDGYSQSGSAANTLAVGNNAVLKITLDGINAGLAANGLSVGGFKSVIKGLVIQRFGGSGIVLTGSQDQVYGCFIGTNAAGTQARGNRTGVTSDGSSATIGSSQSALRNVISGNTDTGVHFTSLASGGFVTNSYVGTTKSGAAALGNGNQGVFVETSNVTVSGSVISGNGGAGVHLLQPEGSSNSKVLGNLIGTDATGAAALGNNTGVFVQANGVKIGGPAGGARNVISGNQTIGILIYHLVTGNIIQGNYVGTNAAGTAALGNGSEGILTQDSDFTAIGGDTAGARNVISGNGSHGIDLVGGTHNTVQGNRIGTKADGTGDLGNAGDGILIVASTQSVIGGTGSQGNAIAHNDANGLELNVQAVNNDVRGNGITANALAGIAVRGDDNGFLGNAIVSNGGDGILVDNTAAGNGFSANQAFSNGGLAIDLAGGTENSSGVTSNDASDPDTGANGLQNFPLLTSAVRSNGNGITTVAATLNSTPSTTFRIEIFIALDDPSGHGEAQIFVTGFDVTTNSAGNKSFSTALAGLAPGMRLSATASSAATNETSEMSANVVVTAGS